MLNALIHVVARRMNIRVDEGFGSNTIKAIARRLAPSDASCDLGGNMFAPNLGVTVEPFISDAVATARLPPEARTVTKPRSSRSGCRYRTMGSRRRRQYDRAVVRAAASRDSVTIAANLTVAPAQPGDMELRHRQQPDPAGSAASDIYGQRLVQWFSDPVTVTLSLDPYANPIAAAGPCSRRAPMSLTMASSGRA
jgi:hypothetical protein